MTDKLPSRPSDIDTQKSPEQLLSEIHAELVDGDSRSGDITIAFMVARFSTLLVVTCERADIQTRRIVRLTYGLAFLTVALLVATLVLLYVAAHTDEQVSHIHEIANEQQHQEKQTDPATPNQPKVSESPIEPPPTDRPPN